MEGSENKALSSEVVKTLNEDLNKLSLSDSTLTEFNDCMQSIVAVDFRELNQEGQNSDSKSNFDTAVKHLMRFSNGVVKALGATGISPGPLGTLCKVTTGLVGFFFTEDITSIVARRFENILDADLMAKCRATCIKISHCINYMQGLPNASKLRDEEKKIHSLLMATDVPVQTGLDEVLYLGEKIRNIVKTATTNMKKFDFLMNYVELYCCLAAFRELFLLYRFAFQSMLEVNAASVKNVLESQITNDRSVLEFLYKPNVESAKLYYNARQGNWPLSKSFCERRELVPENLDFLNKGVYKILSVQSKCMLHTYNDSGMFVSHKPLGVVLLQSDCENRNVFSILTDSLQYVGRSVCANYVKLCDVKVSWYLLKVYGHASSETPCYMIWSESDMNKCMYNNMSSYSAVRSFPTTLCTSKELGPRFFWTLEPV
ncbi:uncharacterized protein LOC123537292 [Mercenaria mercenaria]|uniref:uncharacterized protein LOC123537292 n=1 Tax=Mercenaria mercenaria TaxID=6596 RepID=UPI00234F8FC4|nr:uncharacterized protein LOC123537292 [Mercenaria mercenaria]